MKFKLLQRTTNSKNYPLPYLLQFILLVGRDTLERKCFAPLLYRLNDFIFGSVENAV